MAFLILGTILLAQAEPTIGTVVGTGRPGDRGDSSPATSARLDRPYGVASDPMAPFPSLIRGITASGRFPLDDLYRYDEEMKIGRRDRPEYDDRSPSR